MALFRAIDTAIIGRLTALCAAIVSSFSSGATIITTIGRYFNSFKFNLSGTTLGRIGIDLGFAGVLSQTAVALEL